ncbi:hypothetical protein H8E88_17560 [candidate division KSB1 bacterium]|nr:hypothetical protein [candidate division KSB1 bacterium]
MKKRNYFLYFRILIFILILSGFYTKPSLAQEEKIGDIADGSRSSSVHVIDIYDAEGSLIRPGDQPIMPFSTKESCDKCHDYKMVQSGFHFNASDPDVISGRPGHPWILVDYLTATQLPLSHRNWEGTFSPEQVGLSPWYFVQQFGRQMPGGSIGEDDSTDVPDLFMRWMISGKLEINCLSCHDAEASHDQTEFARNTRNQNFRWAAAATSGFATVRGSAKSMPDNYDIYLGVAPDDARSIPPSVSYDLSRFNPQGKVFMDVGRKIPNERCYFCHSSKTSFTEKWHTDEDVHIAAGLSCVDCHRNGLDHSMIRGYEGESNLAGKEIVESSTCKGCHLGDESNSQPSHGRFGAPKPEHIGLPVVHFDKLACTACHSGPYPNKETKLVKTSMAHGLGVHGILKSDEVLPFIETPVFAKGESGKIEPHNLIWPSYWATMEEDSIQPLHPKEVQQIILSLIAADTLTDSTNYALVNSGKWPNLTTDLLTDVLDTLATLKSTEAAPLFVNGGKIYQLNSEGILTSVKHDAAKPYSWAIGHNVRPAAQALGANDCSDCHSLSSPFHFGKVSIQTPLDFVDKQTVSMSAFNKLGSIFPGLFSFTFFFRPWLKVLMFLSCLIITIVLLIYLFKGVDRILKTLGGGI